MVGRYARIGESPSSNPSLEDERIRTTTHSRPTRNGLLHDQEDIEDDSLDLGDIDLEVELDQNDMESLDFEDPLTDQINEQGSNNTVSRTFNKVYQNINEKVFQPVRSKIIEPISELEVMFTRKLDKYLNEFGNPLILRKFLYMIIISIIVWVIWRSGFIFEYSNGTKFADHHEMLQYVNDHIDLNKFETDLQYLTSISHRSGTKGDSYIKEYIHDSMSKIQMNNVEEKMYRGYVNYPSSQKNPSTFNIFSYRRDDEELLEIDLNELNFTPLTLNDQLNKTNIIYGHYGTERDYNRLTKKFLLEDPFIILLHFAPNDTIPISEQILLAQKYNAQSVMFISTEYQEDYNDVIQQKTAGLLQYGSGDVLSTEGSSRGYLDLLSQERTLLLPYVSVLSLSANQGALIQSQLNKDEASGSVKFANGWYSGNGKDIQAMVNVTSVVKERQPIYNVMGKIEGGEQKEKAIIIGSARNSLFPGALYPNFGTTYMLAVMELLQELKFKYNWTPLRSIYFISFGGSEYNYIGSTEFVQKESLRLQKEIYGYLDISQLSLDNQMDIMTHPLLEPLFLRYNSSDLLINHNVSSISKYGDWTPFLAHGIPTGIMTSSIVNKKQMPVDTAVDTFKSIESKLHESKYQNQIRDTINYTVGIILELVDAPIIPYNLLHFTRVVDDEIHNLKIKYDKHLNFNPLIRSLLQWKKLGQQWVQWETIWRKHYHYKEDNNGIETSSDVTEPINVSKERWEWNLKLSHIGKKTIYEYGIPRRTFYKNVIIGPPFWGHYGTSNLEVENSININKDANDPDIGTDGKDLWIFPGLQDAIWKGDWSGAQEQIIIISKILNEAGHSIARESINNLRY